MSIWTLLGRAIATASISLATLQSAQADVVASWSFNGTGLNPTEGVGVCTPLGGVSYTFAAGVPSDSAMGNQALNTAAYPVQGAAGGGAGLEVHTSTVGLGSVVISWEQRASNTASRFFQFQYSLDGKAFSSEGLRDSGLLEASNGDVWISRSLDLTPIVGINDNPNFAFRLVAVHGPGTTAFVAARPGATYSTSGTQRFDLLKVEATPVPAPGAAALLVLAGFIPRGVWTRESRRTTCPTPLGTCTNLAP